jgi:hypothetical protein
MIQQLHIRGKSPQHPTDRRLRGSYSHSGCNGEKEKSQPLLGIESQSSSPYPSQCTDWTTVSLLSARSTKSSLKETNLLSPLFDQNGRKNYDLYVPDLNTALQILGHPFYWQLLSINPVDLKARTLQLLAKSLAENSVQGFILNLLKKTRMRTVE